MHNSWCGGEKDSGGSNITGLLSATLAVMLMSGVDSSASWGTGGGGAVGVDSPDGPGVGVWTCLCVCDCVCNCA